MVVTFFNIETMSEESGTFLKYAGRFKAYIKSITGKVYTVDIDDFWAV